MFLDFPFPSLSNSVPVDVYESKKAYLLTASLPQVDKSTLKVYAEDESTVCLEGTRIPTDTQALFGSDDYKPVLLERNSGSFQRCLRFPSKVDTSRISAEMKKSGELTIGVPKLTAADANRSSVNVVHRP